MFIREINPRDMSMILLSGSEETPSNNSITSTFREHEENNALRMFICVVKPTTGHLLHMHRYSGIHERRHFLIIRSFLRLRCTQWVETNHVDIWCVRT